MKIEQKHGCPLNNFETCRKFDCAWFTHLRGKNPNTGEDVDEWGCAIAWLPIMLVETAKESRQTAAAVESFRNEVVKTNQQATQQAAQSLAANALLALTQRKM